jgi:hypothetical protein
MNSDRFNEVYKQFISNITKRFKLGEKELAKTVNDNIDENANYYIDFFIKNILSHIDEISASNMDFFKYSENTIYLCDGLNFKDVISKLQVGKKIDNESFHKICTYIMTLYLVLLKDEIKIEKYVNANYCDYESYSQMISVINSKDEIVNNWKENNNDKKVDKIKEQTQIDEKKEEKEKEEKEKEDSKSAKSSMPNMAFPFGDIENTQIGKLASDLAQKIEKDGNFEMPNITNPADIFSMMFSGDKNNPIGNIMSTVCNELDQKIKNGEVDQSKLFSEAQGLMGSNGLFDGDMMKNMANSDMMKNMVSGAGTGTGATPPTPPAASASVKINRKKKGGKKKQKPCKKISDVSKTGEEQDKILEEVFNEVITE